MKTSVVMWGVIVGLAASAALMLKLWTPPSLQETSLEEAIDREVARAMRSGAFPGMVVGVYQEGRRFIRGYGTVHQDASILPGGTTVFQIGSVSKLLTASLLQSLADEGVVSMDATLGEMLGGSTPLSPYAQRVTLRQLATHTSGFPSIPRSIEDKIIQMAGNDDLMSDPYSYHGSAFFFEYLATADDQEAPGRFEYSNFGMGMLAHVLERVTGQEYETLVMEKVLMPLGMSQTAIALTPEMRAQLAQGYSEQGLPTPIWSFAALAGAGAFSSTAEDMLTFIEASLADSGPASERFQTMRVPHAGGEFGIGWAQPGLVDRLFGNRGMVWHSGMVGGYAAYLAIDDATRSGLVILTNQASATETLGTKLMQQVRKRTWAVQTHPAPSEQP